MREARRSGLAHVCPHLRDAIEAGCRLPPRHEYALQIEDSPEGEPWALLNFCLACPMARGLPLPARMLTEAEQEAGFARGALETVAVCQACFDESCVHSTSAKRHLELTADRVRAREGGVYVAGRCCAKNVGAILLMLRRAGADPRAEVFDGESTIDIAEALGRDHLKPFLVKPLPR